MTPPTVQFIPATGGPDWDDSYNGIVDQMVITTSFQLFTWASSPTGTIIDGFSNIRFRTPGSDTYIEFSADTDFDSSLYPYVAGWNETASTWVVCPWVSVGTAAGRQYFNVEGGEIRSGDTGSPWSTATPNITDTWTFLFLTSYTAGDVDSWRDYDGPT